MKQKSKRQFILDWFSKQTQFVAFTQGISCAQLTILVIRKYRLTGNKAKYCAGGISSILAKLVKDGKLQVSPFRSGIKGGKLYILPQPKPEF